MKKGWEIKKLGEVCEVQRGLTYSGKDAVDYSENIVLRATNINLENSSLDFTELKYLRNDFHIRDKYRLKKGSLLICFSSGSKRHLGKVALVDDEYRYSFGGFIGQITPQQEVASKYLFYSLISENYKQYISELTDGVNINNLKIKDLQNFEIPIPPLPEQKRIVSILDRAFEAINQAKANAEQNLKNAKELFQSKLQAIFDNGKLKIDSGEWEEKTLKEISKINYGYTEKAKFENIGPKFLRITDIQNNNVNWEVVPFCKCSEEDIPKYKLEKGDIVFARTGATTGKSYLIENPPISVFASYLIRLKLINKDKFISKFIMYFFNTKFYWDKINSGISGSAQGGFNATKLGNLNLIYPKSIETQKQIVVQLDKLQAETKKLERIYQQKIVILEELKKSILKKAFNGEL